MRFAFLDGLRGIAAFAVVILHAGSVYDLGLDLNAGLAVDFFFCLSGFVIAHTYDARFAGGTTYSAFMFSRLQRLYPMILVGMLLGAAAALTLDRHPQWIVTYSVLGVLMIPALWAGPLAYPVNFAMWSLWFELFANAAYGLERARLTVRALAILIVPAALALVALIYFSNGIDFGQGGLGFYFGFVRVAVPFAIGMLISRTRIWTRIPALPPVVLSAPIAALLIVPPQHWSVDALSSLLVLPTLIAAAAAVRPGRLDGLWSYLGRLSYPLYVIHVPVLAISEVRNLTPAYGVATCLIAAHVALHLLDEPIQNLFRRRRPVHRLAG